MCRAKILENLRDSYLDHMHWYSAIGNAGLAIHYKKEADECSRLIELVRQQDELTKKGDKLT